MRKRGVTLVETAQARRMPPGVNAAAADTRDGSSQARPAPAGREVVRPTQPSRTVAHPAEMAEPEINAFLTHLAVATSSVVRSATWEGSSGPTGPSDYPWS